MTTKMYHRVSTVIAGITITLLVSIIIVVWVQVGHGAFRTVQKDTNTSIPENFVAEDPPSYVEFSSTERKGRQLERVPQGTKDPISGTVEKKKTYFESSHLDDVGIFADVELVKPMKISPPPLHDHDIIYDQLHNTQDHPPLKHHSGHFRHKTAEVWDPHPHYEIKAFGRTLDLELTYNTKFVSPNFHVTQMWENFTQRVNHDVRTLGCYYTGKVKGEENSAVSVSLCNGMTGYIQTSQGNYHIEPIEPFSSTSVTSILHRIKLTKHSTEITDNEVQDGNSEACETRENTIVTQIWPSPTSEEHEHVINKRNVRFDYVEVDETLRDYYDTSFEKHRSIRDVSDGDGAFEFLPSRRRSGNQEYHIETLIVADKTMSEYHNTKDDLIHYILTLMSHVSLLYKDVTVGNPISLAVVKIMILEKKEFTSTTSEEMLKKFCNYQAKFNTHGEHDIALLLTREDICKNSTANQCNTLGVAEVGSMCNQNSSCAIVKDKGLSTSYTISHELGHALSMPHDDDKRCLNFNGGVQANNVMSKVVLQDTKPWLWSACSKHFLTEFLESNRASCLLDTPSNDYITPNFTNAFPGEYFEVDTQCEMEFGKGYLLCPYPEMPLCESLWCTSEYAQGCKTQHMPWADGTRCGESSWCHHGECITLDRNLLRPIPGGWGKWQEWEPCSRTCGGGIKISRRACDSPPPTNGGAYCIGRSIRYGSCNIQNCEQHSPDFREVQCAEFNGMTKGIIGLPKNVKWIPKYGLSRPDEVCKLFCRVHQTSSYYMLNEKVIDGTKCALNTFDICVHGVCRPGGCDNQLESKATLDECGICGGDNSKCTEISGAYNDSSYGYTRVVRIPKGSSNLYIQQRGYQNLHTDDNYLALVDAETGSYILNGNFIVSGFLKDVVFSGMTITYSGAEQIVEHIKTPKNRRLKKDLILEVLSVGKLFPPDISYRYTTPKETDSKYGWYILNEKWSPCTSLCNGKQYLRPSCVALATFTNVSDDFCSSSELQNKIQERACNTHCHFEWNINTRGPCSSHCGIGVRTLYHNCLQIGKQSTMHNHKRKVNDKHCFLLPKPPEVEPCEGSCESTRWEYEEWSQCSKTCGGGVQMRNAKCVDSTNELIDESLCGEKVTEQICNTLNCPIWSYADWTPCSVTCGKGYRKRAYYCHLDGHAYNPDACDQRELLVTKEDCNELPCVNWYASPWSTCNVTCGDGFQNREVGCKTSTGGNIDGEYCNHILKPNDTLPCSLNPCYNIRNMKLNLKKPDGLIHEVGDYNKYEREYHSNNFEDNYISSPNLHHNFQWAMGSWTNCSKKCGTGTQSRMVICRNELGVEDKFACTVKKPVISIKCNEHPCPRWKYADWGECDVDCMQYRQVICQMDSGSAVEDEQCDLKPKPEPSRACCAMDKKKYNGRLNDEHKYHYNVNKYSYKWKFGKWNRCSKSCGRGVKTRTVRCIELRNNVTVVDQFCSNFKKPKSMRPCERLKCSYVWREGTWGECSKSCGHGIKTRNVTCHKVLHEGYVDPTPLPFKPFNGFPRNYCDLNSKPTTNTRCIMKNCHDEFSWYASPWSKCSHPCGKKGRQTRHVMCKSKNGVMVKQHFCPKMYKVKRKRKCNQNKCIYRSCKEIKRMEQTTQNGDYYILIGNQVASIYCYKMDTEEPEEFISLDADVQNYAEIYNKALLDQNSCPSNNRRQDNCDCELLDERNYGYTIFWKIRLNITYLQIINDDFTFSRQINGRKVAYGTSGDCYSKQVGCTQGTFSIDLTRTSFKLANDVRWIHSGDMATSKVDKQDRVVRGRCGGYCGFCLPDPNYGLAVEVT